MKKEKIAISLDKSLLAMVDSTIDNVSVVSRSQAISVLLQSALAKKYITQAVILLRADQLNLLFQDIKGKSFLEKQIEFLMNNGIETIYLVTGENPKLDLVRKTAKQYDINLEIVVEKKQKGNVAALELLQHTLRTNFVLLNGDTLNTFPLKKMIHFHLRNDKELTIGLTISSSSKGYNTVALEGDQIVDYKENTAGKSSVIDAGIYICKPTLFSFISNRADVLEKDVWPKLCKEQQARGYFTYGEYVHLGE